MTPNKLRKLAGRLSQMRTSPQKAIALEAVARQLGRKLVNRGKEPAWESMTFLDLPALTIPHHGGKDLSIGTKNSILIQLEDDVDAWKEALDDRGK